MVILVSNSQVSLNVTKSVQEITVSPDSVQVTTNPALVSVTVSSPGPQGPQGPAGPAGGASFEFIQTSASNSWVIVHNLGRYPIPTIFVDGDFQNPVLTDYTYNSINSLTVSFLAPHTGKVEL